MEASLALYTPGAIVRYDAPFKKQVCDNYGIPASHPVLILNRSTVPDNSWQCMIVSSQIDRYYGYRLYLNTMDPTYKRMSVICTNHVYTIQRKYLRDILGFIPPYLLEQARQAYAYEIGLSSVIPSYYQNDETCVNWINAGQPNLPEIPNPFDLKEGGIDAGRQVAIATYTRPYSKDESGISPLPVRGSLANPSLDPQTIHNLPISTSFVSPPNTPDFDMESTRSTAPAPDPNPGPEKGGVPDPTGAAPGNGDTEQEQPKSEARKRHKFPGMCMELYERIEAHEIPSFTKMMSLRGMMDGLTKDMQFDIFMRKYNGLDLYQLKLAGSRRAGENLIGAMIHRIEKDKADLISGALDHTMNWKMLADRYVPALRAMTTTEIHDVKMGQAVYFKILEVYELKPEQSYIGMCEAAGIMGDQLSATQAESYKLEHDSQ